MLGVAVSSAVCLISGGHTCAPSLITLLCVTPHIVSWSQRQDTFPLPPLPPAVSAISVEISSLPPGALAASAHRSQRLTRMRIRERLRAALPKPVTPAPTMPPSDTGLYLTLTLASQAEPGSITNHWLSLLQAASLLSPATPIVRLLIDSDTQRSTSESESNHRPKDQLKSNNVLV